MASNLCQALGGGGCGGCKPKPRWLAPCSLPSLLLLLLLLLARACDAAADTNSLTHSGLSSASSAVDLNSGRHVLSEGDDETLGKPFETTKARCALGRTHRPVSVPRSRTLTRR